MCGLCALNYSVISVVPESTDGFSIFFGTEECFLLQLRQARIRLSLNTTLSSRRACKAFYEIWTSPNPGFLRFCRATQRAVLANLLLLRHSGSLAFRHIYEKCWALQFCSRTDSRLLQAQRILLGGCLISFAQDKITDEELISSVKNLSVDSDKASADLFEKLTTLTDTGVQAEQLILDESPVEAVNNFSDSVVSDRFINPPLTIFIRQLRGELLHFATTFFHPRPPSENVCIEVPDPSAEESMSCTNAEDTLDFRPDGTGFVDESWDLIVNKTGLRVWRRPVDIGRTSPMPELQNGDPASNILLDQMSSKKSGIKYEYRRS
ncbi:hypothetical protein PHET_10484 [Paragonimus heterotremus]|uniref:Uncharacterized protein n=1 Tax=Paragonimus heterotremus TaxID=100268 RepID=A0A8J4WE49_9TREM|nr:hypothetical protein PHET_10484 [Paragonimus heterotremus]